MIQYRALATPACFSTFYQCAMVPALVENLKYFFGIIKYRGFNLHSNVFHQQSFNETKMIILLEYSSTQ